MSRKIQIKFGLMILAAILGLTLVLQNLQTQTVHFLFARISMPLAGLLISTLAIGFVLGYVTPSLLRRR